jgi:pyruvate/2-oxoglutarate/acetoin dehydrogenase E1 component
VESNFAQFPGIKVACPATPYDAKGLLVSAIRDPNPVVFLEHKMLYFTRGDLPDAGEEVIVPLGKADIKREGKDLTLVTFSYCLLQALEAADELAAEHGIDAEVVDLRSIVPLDTETIYQSVAKTGRLLTVHESQSNCGIGAEVVARIYEEAPYLLKAPARRLGMAPAPIPVIAGRRAFALEEENKGGSFGHDAPPCGRLIRDDPRRGSVEGRHKGFMKTRNDHGDRSKTSRFGRGCRGCHHQPLAGERG